MDVMEVEEWLLSAQDGVVVMVVWEDVCVSVSFAWCNGVYRLRRRRRE